MNETYARRRDLVVGALREIGVEVSAAEGHDLRLGAGPRGPHLDLLLRAGAGGGGRGRLTGLDVRAERRGLLPHLADHARRAHRRGGRADARAPLLGRGFALVALGPVAVQAAPLVLRRGRTGAAPRRPPGSTLAATRSRWRCSYSSSVRSRASSASSRRRSRTVARWGAGSSTAPKWVRARRSRAPGLDDPDRLDPGLDVDVGRRRGGDDQVRGRDRTAATSPTKAVPLSSCR